MGHDPRRHPLIEGFCTACKPADRRPPWQWCEEHVQVDETSPMPGRWRSDSSPWVRPVMDDFANNTVRDIPVQCTAQSANWVARAFSGGGASRPLGYVRCRNTTELENIRRQLNAPVVNAMIDTGFKAFEVYRFCMARGWKAMKGDDAEWFLSQDPCSGKTVRRVCRRVLVDPTLVVRRARIRRHLPLFQ